VSILLFASDLHIPQHQVRYAKIIPFLKGIDEIYLVYFPLPYYVHLIPSQPDLVNTLLDRLKTLEGLASMCAIPDSMRTLFDYPIIRVCPSTIITKGSLARVLTNLLECNISDLFGWCWRGVNIYEKAKRDASLCIKKSLEDLKALVAEQHINFIRLTMISTALSIELAHSIIALQRKSKGEVIHKCVVPDAYSAFIGIGDYCKRRGIDSMILTSDGHFLNLLKISPLNPHPQNIAAHNVQFVCHEYVTPKALFDVAKVYIRDKVIGGQSSQAYSTGRSDQACLQEVSQFIARQEKTLVYYTSSPDEQFGNLENYPEELLQNGLLSKGIRLFADEFVVITDLCHFAQLNGYGLVVRLHPRLGSESRSAEVSTARKEFIDLLTSFQNACVNSILVIPPEMPVSSYWLGAQGSVNIFFRSSIGLELSMLGFPAISPNHLDSYTYQGMGYETSDPPITIDLWHKKIKRVSESGFAYYVHAAVRGFYMHRFSSTFTIDNSELSGTFGGFPECELEYAFPSIDQARLARYVKASSSFALPQINGYWSLVDYLGPWRDYMRWLKREAYPNLDIVRETAQRKLLVQANIFLDSLI